MAILAMFISAGLATLSFATTIIENGIVEKNVPVSIHDPGGTLVALIIEDGTNTLPAADTSIFDVSSSWSLENGFFKTLAAENHTPTILGGGMKVSTAAGSTNEVFIPGLIIDLAEAMRVSENLATTGGIGFPVDIALSGPASSLNPSDAYAKMAKQLNEDYTYAFGMTPVSEDAAVIATAENPDLALAGNLNTAADADVVMAVSDYLEKHTENGLGGPDKTVLFSAAAPCNNCHLSTSVKPSSG